MTLEQYYSAKSALKAPDGLDSWQEWDWYEAEIDKLFSQLNQSDQEVVLSRNRNWQQKLQSSHV